MKLEKSTLPSPLFVLENGVTLQPSWEYDDKNIYAKVKNPSSLVEEEFLSDLAKTIGETGQIDNIGKNGLKLTSDQVPITLKALRGLCKSNNIKFSESGLDRLQQSISNSFDASRERRPPETTLTKQEKSIIHTLSEITHKLFRFKNNVIHSPEE